MLVGVKFKSNFSLLKFNETILRWLGELINLLISAAPVLSFGLWILVILMWHVFCRYRAALITVLLSRLCGGVRYDFLMEHMLAMMNYTGLSMVETDGPYPGYSCSSTNHSHHEDEADSIYLQLKLQSQMYRILREREVYINQPDDYFYQGGSKTGIYYYYYYYYTPFIIKQHRQSKTRYYYYYYYYYY